MAIFIFGAFGLLLLAFMSLPILLQSMAARRPKPASFLDPHEAEGIVQDRFTAGPPLRALLAPQQFVRIDAPGLPRFQDLPYVGDRNGYNRLIVGSSVRVIVAKHPTTKILSVIDVLSMEDLD